MKTHLIFILFLSMLLVCENHIYGQAENRQDSIQNALSGKTGPDIITLFPLTNDINLTKSRYPVIYPLLVINNLQIKDGKMINCFRNNFDRTKINRIKLLSKEKAEKMGMQNVPKDGVLFITIKKGYYFDFSCE